MNVKIVMLLVLVFSVFIVGCEPKSTAYTTYNNQPQGGQQPNGQYVGGGCGVAPSGDYKTTPVESLNQASSGL